MSLSWQKTIKNPSPEELLSPQEQIRWDFYVAGIALTVVILDQISKALILQHFNSCSSNVPPVPVIGQIISFTLLCNPGISFSFATDSPLLVLFLVSIAVAVIGWLYWSLRSRNNIWLKIVFGLIFGGAIGNNLIDRITRGYVVDFIHFQMQNFNFAVFNVADSAICVGMIALAIIFWFGMPRESTENSTSTATLSSDSTFPNKQTTQSSSTSKASTSSKSPVMARASSKSATSSVQTQAKLARPRSTSNRARVRRPVQK
jgi:signal peptidase II